MAAIRKASAIWEGDLFKGSGTVTAETTGILRNQPVTWASRTAAPEGRTSPEELLAAAHAACFSMALANGLAGRGTPARRLEVTAEVTFDKAGEGFSVRSSALTVRGWGRGFDAVSFTMAAQDAKENCPISRALRGNVELRVQAQYAGE